MPEDRSSDGAKQRSDLRAFLLIGVVFFVIGLVSESQRPFIAIGLAFVAIGASSMRRDRPGSAGAGEPTPDRGPQGPSS